MNSPEGRIFSSWKEIAAFLGKGVRTVQRWERTMGLPVRRPNGVASNVVVASESDLRRWMHSGKEVVGDKADANAFRDLDEKLKLLEQSHRRLEQALTRIEARFTQIEKSIRVQGNLPVVIGENRRGTKRGNGDGRTEKSGIPKFNSPDDDDGDGQA